MAFTDGLLTIEMAGSDVANRPIARSDEDDEGDILPVPDPSRLTTAALQREVDNIKEVQKRDREWLEKLFTQKFEATDKAFLTFQSDLLRQPSAAVLQETLLKLTDVTDQRFIAFEKSVDQRFNGTREAVNMQFESVNTRFSDSAKNVNDTMLAQKSNVEETSRNSIAAMDKVEGSIIKQIDSQGLYMSTMFKGTDERINDCKDRLTAIEARGKGVGDVWGWIAGALGLLIAILSAGVAVVVATRTN